MGRPRSGILSIKRLEEGLREEILALRPGALRSCDCRTTTAESGVKVFEFPGLGGGTSSSTDEMVDVVWLVVRGSGEAGGDACLPRTGMGVGRDSGEGFPEELPGSD